MRIGVLGPGMVGRAVAPRLAALGHDVMLGSREPAERASAVPGLPVGTVAEAVAHGEWVVNALPGEASLVTLREHALEGKVVLDLGNYDHAVDQPILEPLGQALQREHPGARVVKVLNSVSAHLMADPGALGGEHTVFLASDDRAARAEVAALLRDLGWQDVIDLGDLGACRAMEQLIPLWMRLEAVLGGPGFNLRVVRGRATGREEGRDGSVV